MRGRGTAPSVDALFTSKSSLPYRHAASINARRCAGLLTSPGIAVTSPNAAIFERAASSEARSRPSMIVAMPSPTSSRATALPSPRDPAGDDRDVSGFKPLCHGATLQPQVRLRSSRMNDILTVGEVAARSGVPASTIHFYEAEGLIRSERTSGNRRRFKRGELRRITIVRFAQRAARDPRRPSDIAVRRHRLHPRLAAALTALAACARRAHSRPDGLARQARQLHRLRVPLTL